MDRAIVRHVGVLLQALSWLVTNTVDKSALYHKLKSYAVRSDITSLQQALLQPTTHQLLASLLDSSRRTLLFYASTPAVAQLLLDGGCSLDRLDAYGQTPLHCAVIAGHVDVCCWMVQRRPQLVHVSDPGGKQPMHHAEEQEMVR